VDENRWDGAVSSHEQFANLSTDSLIMNSMIAAPIIVTHLPASAADLAETPEIQFTPAILAKALELEHKPLKIWEWVRNNIEFVPTYGSIQGADMCLQTKQCNDIDTASLLIALLRASNISARYVYGTLELPIEKAKNWLGGVTDPMTVGTILATNGIPAKLLISGGTITAVQFEHVWVNAWINYIPSRGAVHRFGHEDTWIPLDGSYKQYNYTQGIDIATAVPFDAQTFTSQIQSTATINQIDGSVTNVNSSLIQQTMQSYQTQVQSYIQQNYPNATVGDVIGKKEIKKQELGIMPCTLPYKTVLNNSEFAQVPDNLRETMSFSVPDPTGASNGLSYTTSMPQITGKKITLSFSPATTADQAVVASYTSTSGSLSSLPAYLVSVMPEIRIDGQVVATGAPITLGKELSFTISLNEPGIGPSQIDNIIKAGEYFGIGLDTGKIGDSTLNAIGSKLAATKAKLDAKNYTGLTKDDLIGDLLHNTIATYFAELDIMDEVAAQAMNIVRYRVPSVGMFSLVSNVKEIFGLPLSISSKGAMMDVDRIMQAAFSKDGNMDRVKQYMLASGERSSVLEQLIPEELFSTSTNIVHGISAVKALQIASESGIPIYSIDQSNINAVLPQLQVNADVKIDIANAVSAGKTVTVSKTNITYNSWSGCGYIIIDPNTNAGAYMISSGTSGGLLLIATISLILNYVATDAAAEELQPTYIVAASGNCIKYLHTREYWECVGMAFSENLGDIVGTLTLALLGVAYRSHPMIGLSLAVLSAVSLELWAINTAAQCRRDAIHCD
jgi:hypothetical protein